MAKTDPELQRFLSQRAPSVLFVTFEIFDLAFLPSNAVSAI
jgi:hypothetical protein